ncbi:MAG: hypothetical protein K2L86_10150 [Lachnospiraceae bacterium]|nr:hypothetical protein [Lachnospiraceae bacterium]
MGVFPLFQCRVCASCKKAQYEMCRSHSHTD